jgi:hypothetical protein
VSKDADLKQTAERKRPGYCPVAVDAGPPLDAFQGVDKKLAGSQERHGALRAQQKYILGTGETQQAQIEGRSFPFSKQSPLQKTSPPSNRSPLLERSALPKDPVDKSNRPLEGVPFLVKDVIDVAGFRTVAGCELLLRSPPVQLSASIVQSLQTLGAVPIGKSAVPEACSQKHVDVQTSSRVHGVTGNPYRFDLTPGGSSGGSAVVVAAGMVPLAVGTDWAGSLRIPVRLHHSVLRSLVLDRSYNCRVGLKGICKRLTGLDNLSHDCPAAQLQMRTPCETWLASIRRMRPGVQKGPPFSHGWPVSLETLYSCRSRWSQSC